MSELRRLPDPPYYAVIFTSMRNGSDPQGYAATAARMIELAQEQPGFLGVDSVREESGLGITVSYWSDEAAIAAWRKHAQHRVAQELGRTHWYLDYELRVARVERAYGRRGA